MATIFAAAFVLGLVFNAAPGAVFAETVRRGVRGGFRPAFEVQLGSLVGDALWAALGLAGVGVLMRLDALRVPVAIAGVVYLVWLAVDAWRAANREFDLPGVGRAAERGALRAGVMLSVTNPQNVAYWAAIGSALGAIGVESPTAADHAVFFAGFMASSVAWMVFCAAAVDRLFRRAGAGWARLTYRLCAAAFLALALGTVRDLLEGGAPRDTRPPASIDAPR
jgi:chemosensory pili system protein ChpE/L-lysine exporter family protein LysE/ArgO